jgi:hypothetical protein
MAEGIITGHAHERARSAQPCERHRHVRGRAAGRFFEGRGVDQRRRSDGRHEVDQDLAQTDNVSHSTAPSHAILVATCYGNRATATTAPVPIVPTDGFGLAMPPSDHSRAPEGPRTVVPPLTTKAKWWCQGLSLAIGRI